MQLRLGISLMEDMSAILQFNLIEHVQISWEELKM